MPPKDLSLIFKSTLFCRYGKSSQSPENRYDYQKKAVNRCSPRSDSGRTKGYEAKQQTFCLHFARGVCVEGYNCMYLHHLPTGVDDARNNMLLDIFGREKHRDDREDNGGTGSYIRPCRTLFVYFGGASQPGGQKLRQMLSHSFGEWGPIEDIHVVPSKCIGFVRYKFRASAEFAKEAMMGQVLQKGDTTALTVRWANDDPNPVAIEREKRQFEESIVDAVQRSVCRRNPSRQKLRISEAGQCLFENICNKSEHSIHSVHPGSFTRCYRTKSESDICVQEDELLNKIKVSSSGDTGFQVGERRIKSDTTRTIGFDALLLGAQHAAYEAYIAAGGKPEKWDFSCFRTKQGFEGSE